MLTRGWKENKIKKTTTKKKTDGTRTSGGVPVTLVFSRRHFVRPHHLRILLFFFLSNRTWRKLWEFQRSGLQWERFYEHFFLRQVASNQIKLTLCSFCVCLDVFQTPHFRTYKGTFSCFRINRCIAWLEVSSLRSFFIYLVIYFLHSIAIKAWLSGRVSSNSRPGHWRF